MELETAAQTVQGLLQRVLGVRRGSHAQGQCKTCHQQGGQAGGTTLFTGSAEDNHLAMQSFVTSAGGSADLVLSKITGGAVMAW